MTKNDFASDYSNRLLMRTSPFHFLSFGGTDADVSNLSDGTNSQGRKPYLSPAPPMDALSPCQYLGVNKGTIQRDQREES